MPHVSGLLAIIAALSIPLACQTQVTTRSSIAPSPDGSRTEMVDRYGDPLPKGCIARLGTVRLRLKQSLRVTAFSPDGRLLAVGEVRSEDLVTSSPSSVRLLDTATGREIRQFQGHRAG